MPDIICDTSVFQYLHQLELLHILPALAGRVIVPPSVLEELAVGRASGVPVPDLSVHDWVTVRRFCNSSTSGWTLTALIAEEPRPC